MIIYRHFSWYLIHDTRIVPHLLLLDSEKSVSINLIEWIATLRCQTERCQQQHLFDVYSLSESFMRLFMLTTVTIDFQFEFLCRSPLIVYMLKQKRWWISINIRRSLLLHYRTQEKQVSHLWYLKKNSLYWCIKFIILSYGFHLTNDCLIEWIRNISLFCFLLHIENISRVSVVEENKHVKM